MTTSMIQNCLSRFSLVIGGLALASTMGCATEADLAAEDTAIAEDVASISTESQQPYCEAPWVSPYKAKEWKYYGESGWLNSWSWYSTYNTYNDKYLKNAYRNPGVDLYYYDNGQYNYNMKYEREYGGEVHYGDHVAIKVGNRGYLHYAQQPESYGYEITYQDYPSYEWEVQGGDYGARVPTNKKVSIYNDYRNDYMVYCQRQYGIDMSWASECHDSQYGRYYKDFCGHGGGDY